MFLEEHDESFFAHFVFWEMEIWFSSDPELQSIAWEYVKKWIIDHWKSPAIAMFVLLGYLLDFVQGWNILDYCQFLDDSWRFQLVLSFAGPKWPMAPSSQQNVKQYHLINTPVKPIVSIQNHVWIDFIVSSHIESRKLQHYKNHKRFPILKYQMIIFNSHLKCFQRSL